MALKDWSTTASENDTIGSITFAEGQAPNSLNDSIRLACAEIRTDRDNIEWRDWGHTVVYSDADTFTIASSSDLSSVYTVGRRIRATDATTLYGTITASAYAASTQTVDVILDSGSLSASLTNISLGFDPSNKSTSTVGVFRSECLAYKNADQNHTSSGSWVDITFQVDSYDSGGIHDVGSNTELFVAPTWATKARFTGILTFAANTTGKRGVKLVTSAGADLTPNIENIKQADQAASTATKLLLPGIVVGVTGGASYKMQGFQNTGGSTTMPGTANESYLCVEWFA